MSTTRLYRYRGKTHSYRAENFYRYIANDKISPIPSVHLCCSLAVLSLPLQVIGCFGLKDVHHSALPDFQVVLVSWQGWMSVECLRHTGTLWGTPEGERQKANASMYRGVRLSVWGTAL